MTDPISIIAGGFSIAQSALRGLDFIRGIAGSNVISGYFRHDSTRIEGSEKVEILIKPSEENSSVWWYQVEPLEDYAFIRVPVVDSGVHELLGTIVGQENPDVDYWRWIATTRPGVIVGGQKDAPNAKVDFVVIGYRPKAIVKHFSSE